MTTDTTSEPRDRSTDSPGSRVDQVLLAEPRGFCAGVEMAIKALAWMVRSFPAPVYCYHEIVHNQLVVAAVRTARAWCSSTTSPTCRPGMPIMLSAHGSPPEVVEAARARGSYVVDSVCPLVTKVHHEVKVRAGKGYRIIYVGHEGHEEAVGTMAVAPDSIDRVQSVDEVDALADIDQPVALLAQTTLSHRDWEGVAVAVKQRFPDVWTPGRSDLCFATTNRQAALMALADRCDAIVVLGSANSSNTQALEQLAREAGCRARVPRQRRRRAARRPRRRSSASRPAPRRPRSSSPRSSSSSHPVHGVELVHITDEDEYFPPPRNIRDLQAAIETASTVLLGGSLLDRPGMDDRSVGASDVLAALSA